MKTKMESWRYSGDIKTLGINDFASLFGVHADEIPVECKKLIKDLNFRFISLDQDSRDKVLLQVIKSLDSSLPISGKNRIGRWQEGWGENLQQFIDSGYDESQLLPGYYKKGIQVMRLAGNYVLPEDPNFESNFLAVLISWIGKTFLNDVDHIYEFGCGPAHNLVALAKLFPQKQYYGLDWAQTSQEIIIKIVTSSKIKISGHHFDMFTPDYTFQLKSNSAVFTNGALEQLGTHHEQFFQYLLKMSPKICIHVEPIYELYNQENLIDYLAAKYSDKRGYLNGYFTHLKKLEETGTIKLLHVQKNLGSMYHDGWTTVVWEICSD